MLRWVVSWRWLSLVCIVWAGAAMRAQTPQPLRPVAIAYDTAGDLYIADAAQNRVLESTVGGAMRVVAGTGAQGFGGDGFAATSALLNRPAGVAVGADGAIFIADTGNERIRAVGTDGTMRTVAGAGAKGFAGDGGPALMALFCEPSGLAVAGDLLYIADRCNQRVRMLRGGVLSTAAGSGVEGFGGDGGVATSALLDSPQAVAVDAAGRILIADTRNHRVRVVATDGTISTFAGNGTRGRSGDGDKANKAQLASPIGLAVLPDASVVIADAGNQCLRSVDAQGVIITLAGSGVQGAGTDGETALLSPLDRLRGLASSAYGLPVFADAGTRKVEARLSDGRLYRAAGMSGGSSNVRLTLPATAVYGAAGATVTVIGPAGAPQGVVTLAEGGQSWAAGKLAAGSASIPAGALTAGPHVLVANYPGDGFNPAAVSDASTIEISPAPVVASAAGVSLVYGQEVPVLRGTMSGILAQDEAVESVVFSTTAGALSPPGTYPITASVAGPASGNYAVSTTPDSGSVTIAAAPTTTSMSVGTAYAGLPLTLSVDVTPAFGGVPSGSVQFTENGSVVATGALVNGVGSAVYLAPAAGSHVIAASYGGDGNFKPSTSAPATAIVSALPDFSVSVRGSATALVSAGSNAVYQLVLAPTASGFSSAVSLSASGLANNVVASITPSLLIPSSSGSTVSIVVPTSGLLSSNGGPRAPVFWAWLPLGLALALGKRRRLAAASFGVLLFAGGCGARTVPEAGLTPRSFTIHITGTATSLAGTVLSHSVDLNLQVQ